MINFSLITERGATKAALHRERRLLNHPIYSHHRERARGEHAAPVPVRAPKGDTDERRAAVTRRRSHQGSSSSGEETTQPPNLLSSPREESHQGSSSSGEEDTQPPNLLSSPREESHQGDSSSGEEGYSTTQPALITERGEPPVQLFIGRGEDYGDRLGRWRRECPVLLQWCSRTWSAPCSYNGARGLGVPRAPTMVLEDLE